MRRKHQETYGIFCNKSIYRFIRRADWMKTHVKLYESSIPLKLFMTKHSQQLFLTSFKVSVLSTFKIPYLFPTAPSKQKSVTNFSGLEQLLAIKSNKSETYCLLPSTILYMFHNMCDPYMFDIEMPIEKKDSSQQEIITWRKHGQPNWHIMMCSVSFQTHCFKIAA